MDPNVAHLTIQTLEEKVGKTVLPPELVERLSSTLTHLKIIQKEVNFSAELDNASRYIDWVTALPWEITANEILDLTHAKKILDKNHYGLVDVKDRILEYISIMILKKSRNVEKDLLHAPVLSMVGLVGTGKTTIASSIAECLGRPFVRIPFGGMGGAAMLRGQPRIIGGSEPGVIIKALKRVGVKNPVILLDEIDRVSEGSRSDIMGVLIELLDPAQNRAFMDYFVDYPFDLSSVLFITTSNNTKDISVAVLDRLEVIQMPSYTDEQKREIAKSYMLPAVLKDAGLSSTDLIIAEGVWEAVIRPLGYDPGIRTLQRTIEGIVRKVARLFVEGKVIDGQSFLINEQNIKEFIPQW